MRKKSVLSFALALFALAPLAPAQISETYELVVPVGGAGRGTELHFPQFDPQRGQLFGVQVEYFAEANGTARVENMNRSTATVSLLSTYGVAVQAFEGEILMLSSTDNLHVQRLDPFDGILDYDGQSGFQIALGGTTAVQSTAVGPDDAAFGNFLGRKGVKLNASGLQINTAYGLDLGDVNSRMNFQVTMRLTYTYIPNGEPLLYDVFPNISLSKEKFAAQQQDQKRSQGEEAKAANQNSGSSGEKRAAPSRKPAANPEKEIAQKRASLSSRRQAQQQER